MSAAPPGAANDVPSPGLTARLRAGAPAPLDVALGCRAGELLALSGPSGSGKTRVLRLIAGLERAREGEVRCGGRTWFDGAAGVALPPRARRVGFVFQHYALFPHLDARANVALAMGHLPRAARAARAEALLERVNMGGLGARRPAALSGGQRQRVALARALAREPAALLLDEPFSAVDQQTRRKLYRELAALRATLEIPILLVTHDLAEVQQLADTLALIHRGRTLEHGPVDALVRRPASRLAARLLGHQNLFRATLLESGPEGARYRVGTTVLDGPPDPRAPGAAVTLLVPPAAILVDGIGDGRAATRPPPAGARARLEGRVTEAVPLGDELSLRLRLDAVAKALRLRVPRRAAEALRPGAPLAVRVIAAEVHAMDEEPPSAVPAPAADAVGKR